MSGYKAALTDAMASLAADPARVFVGYGLKRGRAAGTLAGAAESQILETPVAENLMVGLAIGLSLRGKKPVVYIERADFLLNALDAIVNHLDKIAELSDGEFRPAAILRIVVGNRTKPLFTGPPHVQNFAPALDGMVRFAVRSAFTAVEVAEHYDLARLRCDVGRSTAIFEFKDLI